MPQDIQVNITHTTWIHCLNGTMIPNDILKSCEDMADEVTGDIVVEFSVGRHLPGHYHYDYDNEVWHDEEGYVLNDEGDWVEDPEWSWPTHLTDYRYREDGTEQVPASFVAHDIAQATSLEAAIAIAEGADAIIRDLKAEVARLKEVKK